MTDVLAKIQIETELEKDNLVVINIGYLNFIEDFINVKDH